MWRTNRHEIRRAARPHNTPPRGLPPRTCTVLLSGSKTIRQAKNHADSQADGHATRKNQIGRVRGRTTTASHRRMHQELPEDKRFREPERTPPDRDLRSLGRCPAAIGGCRVKSRSHAKTRAARQPFSVKIMLVPFDPCQPVSTSCHLESSLSYIHEIPLAGAVARHHLIQAPVLFRIEAPGHRSRCAARSRGQPNCRAEEARQKSQRCRETEQIRDPRAINGLTQSDPARLRDRLESATPAQQ